MERGRKSMAWAHCAVSAGAVCAQLCSHPRKTTTATQGVLMCDASIGCECTRLKCSILLSISVFRVSSCKSMGARWHIGDLVRPRLQDEYIKSLVATKLPTSPLPPLPAVASFASKVLPMTRAA